MDMFSSQPNNLQANAGGVAQSGAAGPNAGQILATGAVGIGQSLLESLNPLAGAAKIVGGAAKTIGSLFGGGKRRREQKAAKKEMAGRKRDFENLDTSNPYKNITNPYQNLTVSTQAADFAAQQTAQGSANIMNNLAAAAGGGGVAALAQSLANSQAMASQQASADLAKQEQRNVVLGAQGENQRQMAVAAGETQSQKMEYEKQGTLLGMAQQRLGAANAARQAATDNLVGGIGDMASGVAMGGLGAGGIDLGVPGANQWFGKGASVAGTGANPGGISDRRLKKNIKLIGNSPSGLKIYAFEYIDKIFGEGRFQGVMSDEIPQEAVIKHQDGYDRVNYSKLDVEFKQI